MRSGKSLVKHVFGYWNEKLYFNTPVKEFVEILSEKGEVVFNKKLSFAQTVVDVQLPEGGYVVMTESDFGGCDERLRVQN